MCCSLLNYLIYLSRNALIPTPHSDKSLPSKHRAMGTHDAYSIVLATPCLRRRLRCRESAAHDLPQLRCATCAPVIGTCRYYLIVWTLRSRTAESYANAGVRPVAITTPEHSCVNIGYRHGGHHLLTA